MVCFELLSLTVFVSQAGTTVLHIAANKGHLPLVEFLFERAPQLIEARTNVSTAWYFQVSLFLIPFVTQEGSLSLHFAAAGSHPSVVKWITDRLPYHTRELNNDGASRVGYMQGCV